MLFFQTEELLNILHLSVVNKVQIEVQIIIAITITKNKYLEVKILIEIALAPKIMKPS